MDSLKAMAARCDEVVNKAPFFDALNLADGNDFSKAGLNASLKAAVGPLDGRFKGWSKDQLDKMKRLNDMVGDWNDVEAENRQTAAFYDYYMNAAPTGPTGPTPV